MFASGIEKNVGMRGVPDPQLAMLMTLSPEDLIPAGHPIRRIRRVVEDVLVDLDGEFDAMYSSQGRRSVPPEALLKATVLMALYSIRSERAFCERLNYDLLFKWFLDLPIDAKAFDATTFTRNRERFLDDAIADRFFEAVVRQAQLRRYVSSEHFSVDGTLLEAWASHKSFKPNPTTGEDTDGTDPADANSATEADNATRPGSASRTKNLFPQFLAHQPMNLANVTWQLERYLGGAGSRGSWRDRCCTSSRRPTFARAKTRPTRRERSAR